MTLLQSKSSFDFIFSACQREYVNLCWRTLELFKELKLVQTFVTFWLRSEENKLIEHHQLWWTNFILHFKYCKDKDKIRVLLPRYLVVFNQRTQIFLSRPENSYILSFDATVFQILYYKVTQWQYCCEQCHLKNKLDIWELVQTLLDIVDSRIRFRRQFNISTPHNAVNWEKYNSMNKT